MISANQLTAVTTPSNAKMNPWLRFIYRRSFLLDILLSLYKHQTNFAQYANMGFPKRA